MKTCQYLYLFTETDFFVISRGFRGLTFSEKNLYFISFQYPLYPLQVWEKTFSALVCQILIICNRFSRKKGYFFVFEWWFYTFQYVRKWQNNPFSGGSKYIKLSQFTIFQNLWTKFRVKTQWWELFLFRLFNIKVLSEDFLFSKSTKYLCLTRGSMYPQNEK